VTGRHGRSLDRREALSVVVLTAATAAAAYGLAYSGDRAVLAGFLLVAAVPFVALAAPHGRELLLGLVVLDLVLQWGFSLNFDARAAALGAEGGLDISLTTIALGGLYALWAADSIRPAETPLDDRLAAIRPLIAYVAVCALSVVAADDRFLAGAQLAMLVQTLLLVVYLACAVRTLEAMRFVVAALMVAIALEGLLTLILSATGWRINAFGIQTVDEGGVAVDGALGAGTPWVRFGGTIGGPNTAASVYELLLPIALCILLAPGPARLRRLAALAIAFGVPALFITGSRAGAAAFVAGACVIGVVAYRRRWVSPRVLVGGAGLLALLALPFAGPILSRVTDDEGSASARGPMAEVAIELIRDRPLLGVGLNNVPTAFADYAGPEHSREFLFAPHNKFLLVASEAGLLALAAFVWFLVTTIRRAGRFVSEPTSLRHSVGLGALVGLGGYTMHLMFDIFSSRAQVGALWFVAGCLIALESMPAQADSTQLPRRREGLSPFIRLP
jgi:O-antigen ligase